MPVEVMTAPLAVIKVKGIAIGKMKNIRVSERFNRQKVTGLGQLLADEVPVTSWEGTLSCSFFLINFFKSQIPNAIIRLANTIDEWTDTVLLQENGVQVDILRKVADSQPRDGSKVIQSRFEVFASVKGCFMNSESFDISEGSIGGRETEFMYTTPIIFPL